MIKRLEKAQRAAETLLNNHSDCTGGVLPRGPKKGHWRRRL